MLLVLHMLCARIYYPLTDLLFSLVGLFYMHVLYSRVLWKMIDRFMFQHANEDVEKMLLGNKCDMEEKRSVPNEKGMMVCSP